MSDQPTHTVTSWLRWLLRKILPRTRKIYRFYEHKIAERLGDTVAQGPFAPMRYAGRNLGSAVWPKRLGTYELELSDAVERLIARSPDLVFNIGAAEGYYAVGMAMRCEGANVIAYEILDQAGDAITALASDNAVADRITVRGRCDPHALLSVLAETQAERPLLIVDIEGYERQLLSDEVVGHLTSAALLVELHDLNGEHTIIETLESRFAPTHRCQFIPIAERRVEDLPESLGVWRKLTPRHYFDRFMDEYRFTDADCVSVGWLVIEPLGALTDTERS